MQASPTNTCLQIQKFSGYYLLLQRAKYFIWVWHTKNNLTVVVILALHNLQITEIVHQVSRLFHHICLDV